ncbi:hypothetical protein EAF00_007028 [Botryotinia globosa]|nr:hypothetical protein EAF00_007028 [Botryotinia globosa]
MVLSLVQYRIFQAGVPIGSLFIAFRITDLTSLSSPEFWAALTADRSLEGRTFRAEANLSELWPNRIDYSYSSSSVCSFSNMLFTDECPAGGHAVIQMWARTQEPSFVEDSWNITMPITLSDSSYDPVGASLTKIYSSRFIEGIGRNYNTSDRYGSKQSLALLNIAGIRATSENGTTRLQALDNDRSSPAPQAFAACSYFYYNISNENGAGFDFLADFQLTFLEKDPSNGQYWYAESKQAFESWKSSGGWPLALWIAPTNQSTNSPSVGVVALRNFSNADGDMLRIETCSIYAGWRSSEPFIDPKTDQYIYSPDLTDPTKDMEDWASAINESRDYPMRSVQIDIDRANFALPPNYTILSIALSSTVYQAIPLGLTISSLIPDAMSRICRFGEISIPSIGFEASEQTRDRDKYTYITVNRLRYGYSYCLRGITRWLSLSILLLHIFLALAHTVIITRMGWTSKVLKSLCKILVLAMNSSPSAVLDNTCAGIER